jgi:hypothetical protein
MIAPGHHSLPPTYSRAPSPDEELAYIADESPQHLIVYRLTMNWRSLTFFSFSVVIFVQGKGGKGRRYRFPILGTSPLYEDAAIAYLLTYLYAALLNLLLGMLHRKVKKNGVWRKGRDRIEEFSSNCFTLLMCSSNNCP